MATAKEPRQMRGPQLEAYQVVLRPLITEKGTNQSTAHNAYPFEVNPWATKDEIKAAIQDLFSVRVLKVCTQNRQGKTRRFRYRAGRLSHWKKAIVTLHPDDGIDFY